MVRESSTAHNGEGTGLKSKASSRITVKPGVPLSQPWLISLVMPDHPAGWISPQVSTSTTLALDLIEFPRLTFLSHAAQRNTCVRDTGFTSNNRILQNFCMNVDTKVILNFITYWVKQFIIRTLSYLTDHISWWTLWPQVTAIIFFLCYKMHYNVWNTTLFSYDEGQWHCVILRERHISKYKQHAL